MRTIFRGPVRFWLLWIGVIAALYVTGRAELHVTNYGLFLAILIGLALISVLMIVFGPLGAQGSDETDRSDD